MAGSQWERLLKNEGAWVGSFTQLSPLGRVQRDIPSVVSLQSFEEGKAMRQIIQKSPPGEDPQRTQLEYRSLARSVLFLADGAFSQGSMQWGPFSEFGAELGLIAEPHRLRLVQLFGKDRSLQQLTLIREHREGTTPSLRPPLTVADLEGTWQGNAVTIYPDWAETTYATQLQITRTGDRLQQVLSMANGIPPMASEGRIEGDRICFEGGSQTVQLLLLPDGASSVCPTHIEPRQPIFLEVGWLLNPHQRQRLIRQYNAQGTWTGLTLVTETKVTS